MSIPLKTYLEAIIPAEHAWKMVIFQHWQSLLGTWSEQVIIHKIERDVLTLAVTHPAWANEMQHIIPTLKLRINELFETPRIQQIKCVCVMRARLPQTQLPGKKPSRNNAHIPPLTPAEKQTLGLIHDPELQSSIAQFLTRCKIHKGGL